jgi:hypothetical protein
MAFSPSAGASTAGTFSKFAFGLIILILIGSAITMALEHKSLSEGLYSAGETLFLSTQSLGVESQNIVANGGVIDITHGFKTFFTTTIASYGKLLISILTVLLWIKVFAFFTSRSNTANPLAAYFLAFVFFYFFQVIFILGYAGLTKNVSGLVGPNSVTYYLSLPIMAFWYFIQAIPYLIKPISKLCGDNLGVCTTIA